VKVTVAMVDDRAGFTVNKTTVYVDETDTATQQVQLPGGDQVGSPCKGRSQPLVDNSYAKDFNFNVVANASFVEATTPQGASLTICSPTLEVLSSASEGSSVITDKGVPIPATKGTDSYRVYATVDAGATPNTAVTVTTVVHYEPDTRK
jgi:hypothetical protein